ncbi:hypothetical protein UVI_02053750 [Ustilaginoidea virens]|uniref:SAM-dependent MTase RsmB/NOP-type domain-containing protein n=1 Tax=Ustilaginoidea virens TaxID=1159556 RepID=A0A1B5L0C1_USTVR|nr:hypothetical protein UVI_02053750 [Ustilaginoidea virens]
MPHSSSDGPLAKRQKVSAVVESAPSTAANPSRIFAPFRTVGLVSSTSVPFTSIPLGTKSFQLTTSVGRALQTYDVRRGLNLVFVTRPETPANITATFAWKQKLFAAWGDGSNGEPQGFWVFQRGKKVDQLELPAHLAEPITQVFVFGNWIVACAKTRVEVFKTATLEHYTTLQTMAAKNGGNEITGGVTSMPTFLNKVFIGRKDGWVEIWNVSTGKLVYTILPPTPDCGSVTCLEPSTALSLMAIAYSSGTLIITNVLTDKPVIQLEAGSTEAAVGSISFRTDGKGAGHDGSKDGVMATASQATGDITFWDLNKGGRVMGVLRSAHNPPSRDGKSARGGINRVEFLAGQPVIVSSGLDNSLKTWIFDTTPFSPIPRILHSRSGHAGPVNCLRFLPSDFDGSESGNKWLLSGGRDRSLWGWSLRRDGQSMELSQGQLRQKAKKIGILASNALAHGPTTLLEDLKAAEITSIAMSLNRDGGIGAIPGKLPVWQKGHGDSKKNVDAEISGMTGWESVVTAHKGDRYARTWFWGRKRAGRWAFPTGDAANVSSVAISPCGTFAVVGSEGGSIDMFNLQSGTHRQRFPSRLTPSQARQVRLQQLRQADDVAQLEASGGGRKFLPGTGRHTQAVTGLVVDAMNKAIVSCSLDGKIKFWDFLTGTLVEQLDWAPMTYPTSCRYHAANNLLAFSCNDLSIRVVDMETKRTIREFWGPQNTINDFCFSHDGRWVIAASNDRVVRVWDLPTSHLIDAIRLEKPCTALDMSVTGEYLAATLEEEPGVTLWTNKSLFKHVPTRQISEKEIGQVSAPTVSGEGNEGLLEGAFEDDKEGADHDDTTIAPSADQLSSELMTLSLVPKSRWQTLLHLDLIKERNKPREAPKAPEKAPFFLPSTTGAKVPGQETVAHAKVDEGNSRITKLDKARFEEQFSTKLRVGAEGNDCRRGGGGGGGGGRGNGQSANGWRDYAPFDKNNAKLEEYYNSLLQLPEEEKTQFWEALRRELPNSFRFTGSRGHALSVKRLLQTRYIPQIASIEHHDGRPVEAPKPVAWYPDELAWWMTTPKNVVRKFPPFSAFQKFLVSETTVGNISRQEVVSMIPPCLMDLRPGMAVLDMCAAPGSKSAQLLEMIHRGEEARVRKVLRTFAKEDGLDLGQETQDEVDADLEADPLDNGRATGLLIANDSDYKRGHMLVHQLKRLSSPNLIVTNHDATQFPSLKLPSADPGAKPTYLKFDRILADVPCSGDGTLRKNANLWKDWQPGNALGLHATQIRILVRALQLLRVGGRVVYSTCSMNPVENESVVASAIERCGGGGNVEILDCSDQLPNLVRRPGMRKWRIMDKSCRTWETWEEVEKFAREENDGVVPGRVSQTMFPKLEGTECHDLPLERCMRVYPHLQDTGGFFITVLEKKTDFKARNENEPKNAAAAASAAAGDSNGKPEAAANNCDQETTTEAPAAAAASETTESKADGDASANGNKRTLQDQGSEQQAAKKARVDDAADSSALTPAPLVLPAEPPSKPKKSGPPEEPFKYLDPSHPVIESIKQFYSLSARFPDDRYMVRNELGEPAKAIYYTSALIRDILTENEGRGVRFVHGGVRMYMKQDAPSAEVCRWRIQSEGMPIVQGYVGEPRVIRLRKKETLRKLLIEMFPRIADDGWRDFDEIGERVRDMGMGCCVLRVEPEEGDADFTERMALPLWKSIHSLNLMLPKEDRAAMLLRIFNDTTPLINNTLNKQQDQKTAEPPARVDDADGDQAVEDEHVEDLPSPEDA